MGNAKKTMDFVQSFIKSKSLDEKIERLKRKSECLHAREEDIREELTYAETLCLKRAKKEVKTWLEHVAQINDEVHKAEQKVQDRQGKWFPNLQLPEKLDRLMTEVEELHRKGNFPRGLTLEAPESRGVTFLTTRVVGQGFEGNKKMVMESLMDDNVLRVGIYGMGGVGKTTLLTYVNNELLQSCSGITVTWVTVSQKFTIRKLQNDIARSMNLNFSCEDDEIKRAAELWSFLERKKNLVLILDDVWEYICLDDVGVRVSSANGCKLILSTRNINICHRMECHSLIRVTPLCEKESWELFRNELGYDLPLSMIEVAKSVVGECDGLPLGIITMARSMKGVDDLFEWRNALENMKESKPGHDDMQRKVFQVLKYSYDMLRDPILQQCFLDCSLYPEDFEINREELINLFINEGLVDGMKSRQAEFDRGYTILNKLVNACLLENCDTEFEQRVKMHDLVRDMALQITSNNPRFLVEVGKTKVDMRDGVWIDDIVKVSLMNNLELEIPIAPPKCPKLSTLLLKNSGLDYISNHFFLHMTGLVMLDLSNTSIEILPNSISELVTLSVLLLRGCLMLKCIPSVAKLKELKKLDLYGSGINEVPDGIGYLVKLRHLNLMPHPESSVIRVREKHIIQLWKLEKLCCLFDEMDSFNAYATSMGERGLISYQLYLGRPTCVSNPGDTFKYRDWADKAVFLRKLCITKIDWMVRGFSFSLPKCVEALSIKHSTIEVGSLSNVESFRNAIKLKSCSISSCNGIQHLFSYTSSTNLFRTIERLSLERMTDLLGQICWEPSLSSSSPSLPHVTFSSLNRIQLVDCYSIERLFSNSRLPNLETIEVIRCYSLVEIISTTSAIEEGAGDTVTVTIPKLLKLELDDLPSLWSLAVISDSVWIVKIHGCSKLRRIPLLDRERCPTSLEEVCIDKNLMESLQWDHPNAIQSCIDIIGNSASLFWCRLIYKRVRAVLFIFHFGP